MTRKNLNDVIHGDRADVRGYKVPQRSFDEWQHETGSTAYSASSGRSGSSVYYGSSKAGGVSCYHTHPALKLPGVELAIYGGSCSHPVVADADIYIGFDYGMAVSERNRPWLTGGQVEQVLFRVADMSVPANPDEFVKLVDWTKAQLEAGRKVHCGCVGGHGRTGMFLSALVSRFGEVDAIEYVRKNYCKKVVESRSQVEFLTKHFGVKGASAHKGGFDDYGSSSKKTGSVSKSKALVAVGDKPETFTPMAGRGSIWG